MSHIELDFSGLSDFIGLLSNASKGEFKKEFELFLETVGNEFLKIVEEQIINREVTDSRLLLTTFHKGNSNNIWEISNGGLTLEVGTTLDYASYANDGHWTNTKGVDMRFVPGYWKGDRFIYDPSAKGGMILKQHWVDGKPYWDCALHIFEKIFPEVFEKMVQDWIDNYFQGFI